MTKVRHLDNNAWLDSHYGGLDPDALMSSGQPVVTINTLAITSALTWQDATLSQDADDNWLATFAAASGQPSPVSIMLRSIGFPVTMNSGLSPNRVCVAPGVNSTQYNFLQAHGMYTASFMHYGTKLRFLTYSRAGDFRVMVDGKYAQLSSTDLGGNVTNRTIDLDFTSAGGAKARKIEIELWHGVYPYGIQTGPNDSIWVPYRRPAPRLYVIGDSYTDGTASTSAGFRDMAHYIGSKLGFDDIIIDALGGTGYYKENAAAVAGGDPPWGNFTERVPNNIDVGKALPDVILVLGSINDQGWGQTNVHTQADTLFTYLEDTVPDAKVFCATFGEKAASTAQIAPATAGVLQAVTEHSSYIQGFIDLLPLLTGTGHTGAEVGDGNRDIYIASDNAHPTLAGHQFYAGKIAEYVGGLLNV